MGFIFPQANPASSMPAREQTYNQITPTWNQATQVADLFSGVLDQPDRVRGRDKFDNQTYGATPFNMAFNRIMGRFFPGDAQNVGVTTNPPNYRGIRLVLPQSRGGYSANEPDNSVAQALQQMVYGELIRRGYPLYGGSGPIHGDFPDQAPNFNPIGFGGR